MVMNSILFGIVVAAAALGLLFVDSLLMHIPTDGLVLAAMLCAILGVIAGVWRSLRRR